MPFAQSLLLTVYYLLLAFVVAVMVYRSLLIARYVASRRRGVDATRRLDLQARVTVQLPIYNERFVVERLIDSVCALDWPRDRLQIQVLDDSQDDTVEITAAKVEEARARGFDIVHVRRPDRTGYKAGALAYGLERARGEFLAVFDADFIPEPDFLRQTMSHFADARVGFVQARWTFLNRDYGPLTQGVGMLLDGHFILEQGVRFRGGYIFNFNGTGGIWRRTAIQAAGGWAADTICEDTDLSYRANLAGYRGVFLEDVGCPGELPVQITALKTQQHRWAKGLTECFLKLMPRLWRSRLPLLHKIEGTFHLGGNMTFLAGLFITLIAHPVMVIREGLAPGRAQLAFFVDGIAFVLTLATQVVFYVVATRAAHPTDWRRRLRYLPFCPLVGAGLAINNARGVLEAFSGLKTEFVRTPKLGVLGRDESTVKRRERTYPGGRDLWQAVAEIGMGLLYVWLAVAQIRHNLAGTLLTALFALALFTMGGATIRALRLERRARAPGVAPSLHPA